MGLVWKIYFSKNVLQVSVNHLSHTLSTYTAPHTRFPLSKAVLQVFKCHSLQQVCRFRLDPRLQTENVCSLVHFSLLGAGRSRMPQRVIRLQYRWILLRALSQLGHNLNVVLLVYRLSSKYPLKHDDTLNIQEKEDNHHLLIRTFWSLELTICFRLILEYPWFVTSDDFFYPFRLCCESLHSVRADLFFCSLYAHV